MNIRQWAARKLQQLAAHIYCGEYYERLTVYTPDGHHVVTWGVCADEYGSGLSVWSTIGCPAGYVIRQELFDSFDDYLNETPAGVLTERPGVPG